MSHFVEVVEFESGEVVKRLGPFASERLADKADDGLTRQLNHERFYTRMVSDVPFRGQREMNNMRAHPEHGYTRLFQNERRRPIEVSVKTKDGGVLIRIASPDSESENHITLQEAKELHLCLSKVLEQCHREDKEND